MLDLDVIDDPRAVITALDPVRTEILRTLAEPGSAESLAEALREALADPAALDGYARRARDEIRGSALDLETTVARYAEILAEVIESKPASRGGAPGR